MAYHLQHPKTTFLKEVFQRKSQVFSFLAYRLKWNLFPRLDIVSKFPLHVDIEVTNRCNLRCTMCVQNSKEGRKNQGDIEFDLACKILEAIGGGRVFSIKFNWKGEPMLYRKLPDLIAYAKSQKIPEVQINSNATLMDKNYTNNLIRSGLDRIIFSIDGASAETYEKIRIGGKYKTVIKNIQGFLDEKRKFSATYPFVRVQMVVGETNKHETMDFTKYWRRLGVQIALIDAQNRLRDKNNEENRFFRVNCFQPWQRLTISYNGYVFPCCADWFQKSPIWKISQKMSVSEIRAGLENNWKEGKDIGKIRKSIQTGDLQNSLCSECPFVVSNKK